MTEILDKSKIGQRVRQLRLLHDYTQAEFAELRSEERRVGKECL